MKQIFLKVLKDGTTTSNVSSLVFDGENLTTKVSIDYSQVEFSDWIKQADIFVGQTRETDYVYTNEVGNVLEFLLEEGHLVKGYLRIQPLVKRLEEGSIYSKQKWETIELKVKKSLNVLEDDISITQSIAEQWEIRIQAVEDAEVIRVENEDTRILNEQSRIDEEIIRDSNEDTRIANENIRIAQENARNVFVAYNPLTSYVVGNKVSYLGSSYVCILNSLGNLPTNTTYWLLIASKGEQGIQGANTTATNVTNTPSGNINATTVQGAINELDTEKADKLFATNLVTNGDFSNGTTGWLSTNVVLTANANEITATGNGGSSFSSFYRDTTLSAQSGKKIYVRSSAKITNGVASTLTQQITGSTGGGISLGTINNPVLNQNYIFSNVFTLDASITGFVRVFPHVANFGTTSAQNGSVVKVAYVLAKDLTSIFGSGKEPTASQVDWLLAQKYTNSWFDGTKELTSITDLLTLVNTKADKTQEAWITPTLLNGWVADSGFPVGYFKDNMGVVHIKGRVSSGTTSSTIFVLPAGYRTLSTLLYVTLSGTSLAGIGIYNTDLKHYTGGVSALNLNCMNYKSEA